MKQNMKKIRPRILLLHDIFLLFYAAAAFIMGGVAQRAPVPFPFMPMIAALFTGTVFMLYTIENNIKFGRAPDQGKTVQRGTRRALMREKDLYRRLIKVHEQAIRLSIGGKNNAAL